MRKSNAGAELPQRAKGSRPYFFEDPAVDKLVGMILGLAGEVSVLHDRLDSLERISECKGIIFQAEIENFVPDAKAMADREKWRDNFLDNVLRVIHQEIEDPDGGRPNDPAYAKVVQGVQK